MRPTYQATEQITVDQILHEVGTCAEVWNKPGIESLLSGARVLAINLLTNADRRSAEAEGMVNEAIERARGGV